MEKYYHIVMLAIVIAALTEQFKTAVTDKRTRIASIFFGILLAVVYKQGLLAALGVVPAFTYGEYVDFVLTGILAAFGPNVIFAMIKQKRDPGEFKTTGSKFAEEELQ